jgi:hypothetical protein
MGDAHWHCLDCSKDTDITEEFYVLRDDLWRRLVRRTWRGGMLCLDCVERRLGRALHRGDFANVPVNQQQARKCPALARRLATPSPHRAFAHDWRARRSQVISAEALKVAKKWRRR